MNGGKPGLMNVSDVMTPRADLVTATVPGSRDDVLDILQERQFSSVPILKETADGEVFRGLVSRERLIEEPDEEQLALLLEDVESVPPGASIEELARHMHQRGARRVPVVEGGLVGIVTITDVVTAIADGAVEATDSVGTVADRHIHTTFEGTPLAVGQRSIDLANEPYAVVLDEDAEMAGIFTEVDIIALAEVVEGTEGPGDSIAGQDSEWAWEGIKAVGNRILPTRNVEFPSLPVGEVMTDEVVTVSENRTVREAAQLMIRHDIEQIPTISGGELVRIAKDMNLLESLYA